MKRKNRKNYKNKRVNPVNNEVITPTTHVFTPHKETFNMQEFSYTLVCEKR